MSCPYFKEIRVVYCRAYPVKKPVPIDQVTTESCCEGEFKECPLFQEALARAGRGASQEDCLTPAGPKGAKS
jgi:hypothetical protein